MRKTPALALVLLLALGGATASAAYKKPKSGSWKVMASFGDVSGGTMKIAAKKGKPTLTRLSLKIGAEKQAACAGTVLKLGKAQRIKLFGSYKRWAIGRLDGQLIVNKKTPFSIDGKAVNATFRMLFDEAGTQAPTAFVDVKDRPGCTIDFYANR